MKKILKVLFIGVMLVFAVFMFFGMYNTQVSTNLGSLLNEAIEEYDETKDMSNLVRCFGIWQNPMDKTPFVNVTDKDNKSNLAVYSTENQYAVTYTPEGGDKVSIDRLEHVYLFVIVHPAFQRLDNEDKTNGTGLVLNAGDKSYTYLFTQTTSINADSYIASPTSEVEANLNDEREYAERYISNGFDMIFLTLSQTTLEIISNEKLGGATVDSINIVDSTGAMVYDTNVAANLDFSQQFFTDMKEFLAQATVYNTYAQTKDEALKADAETAKKYIDIYMENPNEVIDNFDTYYMQGIKQEQVFTGAPMYIKSALYCLIFLVAAALFYILFFHFELLRNLGLWITQLGKGNTNTSKKLPQKNDNSKTIDAKKSKVEDAPIVEEAPMIEDAPVAEEATTTEDTNTLE